MAPDKIFLHKVRDEESSGYHKMWFESRGRLVPSEEYIRKDALLEWWMKKFKNSPLSGKTITTYLIEYLESL